MYLVHAQLAPLAGGKLPREAMSLVSARVLKDRDIQHVAAHPDGPAGPVLGVFILAGSVEEAERRVAELCHGALRDSPGLHGSKLARCEVVLALPAGPRAEGGTAMA
ncbi:hypothetical protein ACWFQ8_06490 [Streptomyces sp. NPDC055254]